MKIIDHSQSGDEWLSWRRGGIGGSDIPAIMKICPYRTPMDVYKDKKGLSVVKPNAFMQRGSFYEEEARSLFEKHIGAKFSPICVEHDKFSHHRASLDGYNGSYNEVLEIKIPGTKNYERVKRGDIPENYKAQIIWQLYVTGAKLGYLMVYQPESEEYELVTIPMDEDYLDKIIVETHAFWKNLSNNVLPEVQPNEFQEVESLGLRNLCQRYTDLRKNMKELAEYEKSLKSQIIEICQNQKSKCFSFRINKKEVGRIDYKAACMDNHINLDKYKKEPSVTWVIDEVGA